MTPGTRSTALKYSRLLAIGNPIRATGRFVRMIRQAEKDAKDGIPASRRVHAIQIPSTDSPHAQMEASPFGMADLTWLEAMFRRYGKDSLWCASHIFARIPAESSEALIAEAWLDRAAMLARVVLPHRDPRIGRRRISCDLGEGVGRDSTAIYVRDDLGVLDQAVGNAMGLPEAAATINRFKLRWDVADENITYDRLGIGKDLKNLLARHGITGAIGYAGSASPRDQSQFTNIRGEAAWTVRTRLNPDWAPDPRYPASSSSAFSCPPTRCSARSWPC